MRVWATHIDQPPDDDPTLLAWIAAGPTEDPDVMADWEPPSGEGWVCGVCLSIHATEAAAEACHRCRACGGECQEETGACPRCEPLLIFRPEGGPDW